MITPTMEKILVGAVLVATLGLKLAFEEDHVEVDRQVRSPARIESFLRAHGFDDFHLVDEKVYAAFDGRCLLNVTFGDRDNSTTSHFQSRYKGDRFLFYYDGNFYDTIPVTQYYSKKYGNMILNAVGIANAQSPIIQLSSTGACDRLRSQ